MKKDEQNFIDWVKKVNDGVRAVADNILHLIDFNSEVQGKIKKICLDIAKIKSDMKQLCGCVKDNKEDIKGLQKVIIELQAEIESLKKD